MIRNLRKKSANARSHLRSNQRFSLRRRKKKKTTRGRCETSNERQSKRRRNEEGEGRKPKGARNKGVHAQWRGFWLLVSVMYACIVYLRLGTSLRGQTSGTRVHPLVHAGYSATPTRFRFESRPQMRKPRRRNVLRRSRWFAILLCHANDERTEPPWPNCCPLIAASSRRFEDFGAHFNWVYVRVVKNEQFKIRKGEIISKESLCSCVSLIRVSYRY